MAYEAVDYETITLERRGTVAVLTLNRPDRLNAISPALRSDVENAVAAVRADDEARALVLTGAGKGFCAGADLLGAGPVATGRPEEPASQDGRLDEMGWVGRWAMMWRGFDKPVVGAINGVAAGAGMSTAMACDVRLGSPAARFKSVFIERSLSPDSGLSYFLPRVVGYAASADLIFTSRTVEAEEALRIGLLNRIVPPKACSTRRSPTPSRWPSGRRWRCGCPSACCSTTSTPISRRRSVTSRSASASRAGRPTTSRNPASPSSRSARASTPGPD
jgi:2-(1,2-epoxy-1,2-dihydrophenyl)acetyl-CoA isomerase